MILFGMPLRLPVASGSGGCVVRRRHHGRGTSCPLLPLASQKESRMDYQYEQAVEILRRTPVTLTAFLRGLPAAWTTSTAGPGTWSAYDIVGHLLHGDETDWIERTRIIFDHGELRPFDSFDRTAMFEKYQGCSLDRLLAAFQPAPASNLATPS